MWPWTVAKIWTEAWPGGNSQHVTGRGWSSCKWRPHGGAWWSDCVKTRSCYNIRTREHLSPQWFHGRGWFRWCLQVAEEENVLWWLCIGPIKSYVCQTWSGQPRVLPARLSNHVFLPSHWPTWGLQRSIIDNFRPDRHWMSTTVGLSTSLVCVKMPKGGGGVPRWCFAVQFEFGLRFQHWAWVRSEWSALVIDQTS